MPEDSADNECLCARGMMTFLFIVLPCLVPAAPVASILLIQRQHNVRMQCSKVEE